RGRHRGAAGAPRDERGAFGRDVDAIVAGRVDREGGRRRVDLHRMTRLHAAQVERDVAGGDLELQEIGLLVDETHLRVTPRAHERARADLELEVAAVAGVRFVAGDEGRVDLGGRPVGRARPPERDLAIDVTEPGRGATDRGRRVRAGGR